MDNVSQWHRAALLSAAFETVTLQTRMKDKALGVRLTDLAATLNTNGSRNISLLSMAIPREDSLSRDDVSKDGKNVTSDYAAESHVVDLSWSGDEKHLFANVKVSRGADSALQISEASMLDIPERCVLLCSGYSDLPSSHILHKLNHLPKLRILYATKVFRKLGIALFLVTSPLLCLFWSHRSIFLPNQKNRKGITVTHVA